jgi:hypothetical protein
MQNLDDAYRTLDAFASVNARQFDVNFLDIDGGKRGFRKEQSVTQLRNSLPKLFPGLTERRNSLVVRPHSHGNVVLVQLDDLDRAALECLQSVAFLTLCTSPGNHQAWVAIATEGVSSKTQHTTDSKMDLARRLRKGTGADLSASGAVRVAGAVNYKRKYEPDFPTVSIDSIVPGRIVTPGQLEQLGLLAAPEPVRVTPLRVPRDRSWPDYQRCVQGAPLNHAGTAADVSRADFFFCLLAAQCGNSIEEILRALNGGERQSARERTELRPPHGRERLGRSDHAARQILD